MGNRIAKHIEELNGTRISSTYYVLDAQSLPRCIFSRLLTVRKKTLKITIGGNPLAMYELDYAAASFELTERQIYGSARLGSLKTKVDVFGSAYEDYTDIITTHAIGDRNFNDTWFSCKESLSGINPVRNDTGMLSNHLGNFNDTWLSPKESLSGINPDWSHSGISGVLTVVSDKLIPKFESSAPTIVSGFSADLVMSCDYSPFGVTLDGRGVEGSYRYGYQGSEKDDEVKGDGNSYTTMFRQLDPRVGRWLSIDPLAAQFPWQSPYVSMDNNPIKMIDPNGDDPITGIMEAVMSFGVSVASDFLTAYLIDDLSFEDSFDEIGWWSAGWEAVKSYAVASVTPPGVATGYRVAKLRKTLIGKITISTVEKMTLIILDNYSNGKYDSNGEFDMSKVDLEIVFWQALTDALIDFGFEKKAKDMIDNLKKSNKAYAHKFTKYEKKLASKDSQKRKNNYKKKVVDAKESRNKSVIDSLIIKAKAEAASKTGEKVVNEALGTESAETPDTKDEKKKK